MTDAQIQAERLAGKSLAQIAAGKNVTRETLVNTILNAKKQVVGAQVAARKLTQAQADAIYANMQQQVTVSIDRTDVGPARGRASGLGAGGRWNR
jgi:hypothetical protein